LDYAIEHENEVALFMLIDAGADHILFDGQKKRISMMLINEQEKEKLEKSLPIVIKVVDRIKDFMKDDVNRPKFKGKMIAAKYDPSVPK